MKRNIKIKKIFEICDDSLQGVIGYHLFVISQHNSSDIKNIKSILPNKLPLTFSWIRNYSKDDLCNSLNKIFDSFQSRVSLIAMVNVFETSICNFVKYLFHNGYLPNLSKSKYNDTINSYKSRIEWIIYETLDCVDGDEQAIKRLPETIGKIDGARRLRNLIVHNHGLFNCFYNNDCISNKNIIIHNHKSFEDLQNKDDALEKPLLLNSNDIIDFSKAHIEVLHILHNTIQKRYFNVTTLYDYRNENKPIEWQKILWGA